MPFLILFNFHTLFKSTPMDVSIFCTLCMNTRWKTLCVHALIQAFVYTLYDASATYED